MRHGEEPRNLPAAAPVSAAIAIHTLAAAMWGASTRAATRDDWSLALNSDPVQAPREWQRAAAQRRAYGGDRSDPGCRGAKAPEILREQRHESQRRVATKGMPNDMDGMILVPIAIE